jgi:putative phosphoribosyl transferase
MNQTTGQGSIGQAIEHVPVNVKIDSVHLEGYLSVPTDATGVVLFAHGSGSTRHSPRNRFVADLLNESGLATLLIDLLTPDEHAVDLQTRQLRFDIPFLGRRLVAITHWLDNHPEVPRLKVGHFGASTGAGAALVAAEIPKLVHAVVSRGGRPDLAGPSLAKVKAPTLLIVGGEDTAVLESLPRRLRSRVKCRRMSSRSLREALPSLK